MPSTILALIEDSSQPQLSPETLADFRTDIRIAPRLDDVGREALDSAHCMILDLDLSEADRWLDRVREQHPYLPVLCLASRANPAAIVEAMRRGGCDAIVKPIEAATLIEGVERCLAHAEELECQRCARRDTQDRFDSLTPREQQVMRELVRGRSGKMIARRLGISYRTMEKFRGQVMRKMEADSLPDLVIAAVRINLIDAELPGPAESHAE